MVTDSSGAGWVSPGCGTAREPGKPNPARGVCVVPLVCVRSVFMAVTLQSGEGAVTFLKVYTDAAHLICPENGVVGAATLGFGDRERERSILTQQ